MCCSRATPADYDEWGHGWSHASIEPYLRRAERETRTRVVRREELSPWHAACAEAAGDDAILHPVNAVGAVRWNAAFAYLDPARARDNLTILGDTLADRVLLEGDRAVGLDDVGRRAARRSTVVLAAGAYGSPGILLRSGIGRGLPVGEGLTDHVGVGFRFAGTERLLAAAEAYERERPVFMAQVTVAPACSGWGHLLLPVTRARGRRLRGQRGGVRHEAAVARLGAPGRPDPGAPLAIDHGFLRDPRDAEMLTRGRRALPRDWPTRIAAYAGTELFPGREVSAREHVEANVRGFFHPVGTCAIGRVVDGDGRVLGVDGLVVADASVMPTIPRANTNLSTLALAERLAERI